MPTNIDPDTGYLEDAARRPSAPFPDERIPTATTELETGDEKPDAFGDDSTAAPKGVEDGTIEQPDGEVDVPKTPEGAADALNDGKREIGNEDGNTAIAEDARANDTSAEALTGGLHQTDPAVDPDATPAVRDSTVSKAQMESDVKADVSMTDEKPEETVAAENREGDTEEKPRAKRRTKAQIAEDEAREAEATAKQQEAEADSAKQGAE